jgi:hypothetical protein
MTSKTFYRFSRVICFLHSTYWHDLSVLFRSSKGYSPLTMMWWCNLYCINLHNGMRSLNSGFTQSPLLFYSKKHSRNCLGCCKSFNVIHVLHLMLSNYPKRKPLASERPPNTLVPTTPSQNQVEWSQRSSIWVPTSSMRWETMWELSGSSGPQILSLLKLYMAVAFILCNWH